MEPEKSARVVWTKCIAFHVHHEDFTIAIFFSLECAAYDLKYFVAWSHSETVYNSETNLQRTRQWMNTLWQIATDTARHHSFFRLPENSLVFRLAMRFYVSVSVWEFFTNCPSLSFVASLFERSVSLSSRHTPRAVKKQLRSVKQGNVNQWTEAAQAVGSRSRGLEAILNLIGTTFSFEQPHSPHLIFLLS